MNKEETKKCIEVMQAYVDGKPVEMMFGDDWVFTNNPYWDWGHYSYRVTLTKPSINWDHVAPEYKWMATDQDGTTYLYSNRPSTILFNYAWSASDGAIRCDGFSSFIPGTCDWEDSLVERK